MYSIHKKTHIHLHIIIQPRQYKIFIITCYKRSLYITCFRFFLLHLLIPQLRHRQNRGPDRVTCFIMPANVNTHEPVSVSHNIFCRRCKSVSNYFHVSSRLTIYANYITECFKVPARHKSYIRSTRFI